MILQIHYFHKIPTSRVKTTLCGLSLALDLALDVAQMVLEVQKHVKPTEFFMPNSFCFNNFAQKSIPGDVWAQVLQVPVGPVFRVLALPRWSWPSGKG